VNTAGEIDELISPSVDLSKIVNPSLYFRVAYAPFNTGDNDKLAIYLSLDCGHSWAIKWFKKGPMLATAGPMLSDFIPAWNQWSQQVLALPTYALEKNVLFKFTFTGAGGNNIYLDDINISNPSGMSNLGVENFNFRIFPNPMEDNTTLSFSLSSKEMTSLTVMDVLGREAAGILKGEELSVGEHQYSIANTFPAGLYFVKLTVGTESLIEKLIVK
jgi:hypothetical protein